MSGLVKLRFPSNFAEQLLQKEGNQGIAIPKLDSESGRPWETIIAMVVIGIILVSINILPETELKFV